MMIGTNGTLDAVANPSIPAGWAVTSGAGITITPSIVTNQYGHNALRLSFSGTASSASAFFSIEKFAYYTPFFVGLPKFDFEALVRNNASNLTSIEMNLLLTGGSSVNSVVGEKGTGGLPCEDLPVSDDTLFLYPPAPLQSVLGNAQYSYRIRGFSRAGLIVSGYVEISNCGVFWSL